jgi:hypothetical protein
MNINNANKVSVLGFFLLLVSTSSFASPFTDDLSKCLVKSTSTADRTLLIKWMFAALSNHPVVSSLTNISEEKGKELNMKVGALFTDLVTERCHSEAKQALKYEGGAAFEASFNVLGQVAAQGLMGDPSVAEYMSGLENALDSDLLQKKLGDDTDG